MKRDGVKFCLGKECSIRNRCLRYTSGKTATFTDGTKDTYMRKCTNQKMYMQDETAIVKGR